MICSVVYCSWRKNTESTNSLECIYTGCPYRDGVKIIESDGTQIGVRTCSKGIDYVEEMRKDMRKLNELAAEILNITDNWIS